MSGRLLGAALAVLACLSPVQAARDMDSQVEASMLVTGRVIVERDGSLGEWTLDERAKLPAAVANVIDAAARGWRFEPILVDGEPVRGSATMSLLMVAEPAEEGRFRVVIRNSHFGREAVNVARHSRDRGVSPTEAEDRITAIHMSPPEYPQLAAAAGAQGTAYIIVLVDRTGRVREAEVEQVNLRVHGSERDMAKMRYLLGDAALAVTRRWRFQPPVRGEEAQAESWAVRVPVDYIIGGTERPGYGAWQVYIPGPRTRPSWLPVSVDDLDVSPDALVAGQMHQVGRGLKMLGPAQGP